jgi:DNA-binding CsgD family transcriptional regulator
LASSSETDVVGRTVELSKLLALVDEVRAGRGGIGWVDGGPGIGKSTLIGSVIEAARSAGCAVHKGSGDQLLEAFPLRLMADCLSVSRKRADPLRIEIADLLSGETASGVADPLLAAEERMLALVDRLCAAGPLVLATDDLQWADEASLLVWHRLARSVDQIPLLLLGACRPVAHRPTLVMLQQLVSERGGTVVTLGPLDRPSCVSIAGLLTGAPPGPRLRGELSRAGGNPLYLRELVESLVREGMVGFGDGVAELRAGAGATPVSLTATLGRRLGFLASDTTKALRIAALLGNDFDVGEWCLALRRPAADLTPMIVEAMAAGVLSEVGDRLRFRHELIRQVMVEQLPASLRAVLHGTIAQALAGAGAGLDPVARHLLLGPQRMDRRVAMWLADRPETDLYAAPQVSAELLSRAAEVVVDNDPLWETVVTRWAQALFWLGRDEAAIEVVMRLLRRSADPGGKAHLRIQALRSAGRLRRFEEGFAIAEAGLGDEALSSVWRARLAAWAAMIVAYLSRAEEATMRATQALAEAEQCADPLGIAYARNALCYVSGAEEQVGHIDAALAVLVGDDPESLDMRAVLLSNRLHRLAATGRRDELRVALPQALVFAERVGAHRGSLLFVQAAAMSYLIGEWDDTLTYIDSINPEFLKSPALSYVYGVAALTALHRDDRELAESYLAAGRFVGPGPINEPEQTLYGYVTDALALREELAGRPDQALVLRANLLRVPPGPDRDVRWPEAVPLIRLALAQGDRAAAEAAAAACQSAPGSAVDLIVTATCCRAMLADEPVQLLAAAHEYDKIGYVLHRGWALEEAATRLAQNGDQTAAQTAFRDAVQAYAAVGAAWDIRRADARLRPWGIRRGRSRLKQRATVGWDALTPSETRVAQLVAQGLSNPDIANELMLSRNTVQTHVSHILGKLQLRSRIELVREVAMHSASDRPHNS